MALIHIANIRNKDLNLLAVFVGIAEELNLSRASGRLGLSQPALSHALSRLRDQFDDRLFVRGQRGLVATPRVGTLLPKVRALLAMADDLYGPKEVLNLANLNRKVVIASTAYFETRVMADFIKQAQTKAPGLQLETRSLSGEFPKRELETGEFDLAIAAYFDGAPNGFRIRTVFSDRFVCVCSERNSYLKTKQTTGKYLELRHLQIEVPPGVFAPVDRYLEGKKKRRNISLRIGNFLTPPAILAKSDLVLTCPLSLAESYKEMYPLAVNELPFWLPSIETKMIWHEKNQRDPFNAWLRERMAQADNQVRTPESK
jgi:DNA-binding transcriptional LysR family regulator